MCCPLVLSKKNEKYHKKPNPKRCQKIIISHVSENANFLVRILSLLQSVIFSMVILREVFRQDGRLR